jgi:hypothetical protein
MGAFLAVAASAGTPHVLLPAEGANADASGVNDGRQLILRRRPALGTCGATTCAAPETGGDDRPHAGLLPLGGAQSGVGAK